MRAARLPISRPTLAAVNGAVRLVCGGELGPAGRRRLLHLFVGPGRRVVRLRSDRLWFRDGSREFSIGGTAEQQVCQLVLWLRGLPRRPLCCWSYWCSPAVGADRGLVPYLRANGYEDANTLCVLCGASAPRDWWCLGKAVGPCCSHAACRVREGL